MEALQDDSGTLPPDPGGSPDPIVVVTVVPTVEIEIPEDVPEAAEIAESFTTEQMACLTSELGADEVANLLAGGAPDFSLFAALTTCGIDPFSLLNQ
jgi:hypothetical protein